MKLPRHWLESAKQTLCYLVDERTSGFGGYGDEEIATDNQDYEDIKKIETVWDVFIFLRDQGSRTYFVEYQSCLDPLDGFKVEGKEWPDLTDEPAFRAYMTATYGIAPKEYPRMK